MSETLLSPSNILLFGRKVTDLEIKDVDHNPFIKIRASKNSFLADQFTPEEGEGEDKKKSACFARIYGFSYEGTYFDLPHPTLFLVHGEGEDAETGPGARRARAPDSPSRTGVAAPDFSFADDLKVWSYDKADYTIRMDVETGMFEQVLLDAFFADGANVSGMKVAGSRVSGMKVSGMKVSGMKVSGMKVAGSRLGRGDASD